MHSSLRYRRVLLKLSGEMLTGSYPFGIDLKACEQLARSIKCIHDTGLELAIVIGGGNIFRGVHLSKDGKTIPRTPADQMGMLATLMNGIALRHALDSVDCPTRMMSALECPKVAEAYNWERAQNYLKKRLVLVFVGGTGNPYFTTDTAAALRASEIDADILLKATKVDGVYSKDPKKHSDAMKYTTISYTDVLAKRLQVIDASAITLCRQNQIPIFVFDMQRLLSEHITEILSNSRQGTIIQEET